tara:strand:+ start:71 stop:277 length:207 start_codon:yes stop_codon:yes gene_type:complete
MAKNNSVNYRDGKDKDDPQFSVINFIVAVVALLTITLGYWFLAQGSITLAPILLVVGYVFLIPIAIIL